VILRIVSQLCSLVKLSSLQQELLSQISQTKLNTTQFATQFSIERSTAKSTVWFNLRKLRDSGIIKFNSKVTPTKVGKLILINIPTVAQLGRATGCSPVCASSNLACGTFTKQQENVKPSLILSGNSPIDLSKSNEVI
jgi:hypothetical protein